MWVLMRSFLTCREGEPGFAMALSVSLYIYKGDLGQGCIAVPSSFSC
jgi:hypothetical protein